MAVLVRRQRTTMKPPMQGAAPLSLVLRLTLVFLALPLIASCSRETAFRSTPLTGPVSIAMADNLNSPPPPVDSPRWKTVRLGPEGLERALPYREGVAWIRFPFTLPEGTLPEVPALLRSNPADAEEVFLNGRRIAEIGRIGESYITFPNAPRVISVPAGVLRPGENLLEVRALLAEKNAYIFGAPLRLGDRDRIMLEAERLRRPIFATEVALLTALVLFALPFAFLAAKSVHRLDYFLFIAFAAVYATSFLLGSAFFLEGMAPSPWIQRVETLFLAALPPLMLTLVTSATGNRFGATYAIFAGIGIAFLALDAFLPPFTMLTVFAPWRKAFGAILGLYYLLLSARGIFRHREGSLPILIGISVYVVGSRIELFWGINMRDYSMVAFALSMVYALTARHARMRDDLIAVSSRLLNYHEEERSRIARDLHDTVGQSLAVLRLRLQMLASRGKEGAPCPPETLERLAGESATIIEEVRRAAMDLRPAFLEGMEFPDAIDWCARTFAERSGIDVRFHRGMEPGRISPRVRDNLCRAFQEILSNAVRHASATRIEASVFREGNAVVLEVSDNGVGMPVGKPAAPGLGLSTIRERAMLLGGTFRVKPMPGGGTTITLEVPAE
ncbi:MAG: sensor histidine kinase [bacterium]